MTSMTLKFTFVWIAKIEIDMQTAAVIPMARSTIFVSWKLSSTPEADTKVSQKLQKVNKY